MPWSPIQQKKQDSRKNSGSGGWRWQESGRVGQNLKRRGRVGIIGGPSWNRRVSTPLPYVKKDFKIFHPLHYKTNPFIPGFPPFQVKISSPPPLQPFLKNPSPFYEDVGRGEGSDYDMFHYTHVITCAIYRLK